jgi:hypothetical protein
MYDMDDMDDDMDNDADDNVDDDVEIRNETNVSMMRSLPLFWQYPRGQESRPHWTSC